MLSSVNVTPRDWILGSDRIRTNIVSGRGGKRRKATQRSIILFLSPLISLILSLSPSLPLSLRSKFRYHPSLPLILIRILPNEWCTVYNIVVSQLLPRFKLLLVYSI